MNATQRWQPPHFRRGCWVESHRRSNGAMVKRHWRNGHHVAGHFAITPDTTRSQSHSPTLKRSRPEPILVSPGPNNATVAIALETAGMGRAISRPRGKQSALTATLAAVRWTDNGVQRRVEGLTVATGLVSLPPEVDAVTLDLTVSDPDGTIKTTAIPSPCFINADASITLVKEAQVDSELVNRALALTGAASDLRARNRVRQRLGRNNAESTMQRALADAMREAELPDLPLTQQVTIALPEAGYTVTVERYRPNTTEESPG